MADTLTIGRLAQSAGVNIQTVRYYQRRGLIAQPEKPTVGYRHYPPETVGRIHFIRRAQTLGFSLAEIGDLLALGDGGCADAQRIATRQRALISERIRRLENMQGRLDELLTRCRKGEATAGCPLIDTLSAPEEAPARKA